jgi:hypothetical protein
VFVCVLRDCCWLAGFLILDIRADCANVRSSWFVGSSLSKSEHTVIDLGHGGAPRLVSLLPRLFPV